MASLAEWFSAVLARGESILDAEPVAEEADRELVTDLLVANYNRHALDVAGPRLPFDTKVSRWAVRLLAASCWRLVSGSPSTVPVVACEPDSPAAHLSADAILRFLPTVYRRAKSRTDHEPLANELESVFRRWPLTGVRLDLAGPPETEPSFGGHAGLQLLYAERFVEFPRSDWLPPPGPGLEWVERICDERGRPVPAKLQSEESPRG